MICDEVRPRMQPEATVQAAMELLASENFGHLKTEMLYQPGPNTPYGGPPIMVHGQRLVAPRLGILLRLCSGKHYTEARRNATNPFKSFKHSIFMWTLIGMSVNQETKS